MFNYTQINVHHGYQSNYPQSYGSYQGYGPPGGHGYMNSGPPPPPMGGGFNPFGAFSQMAMGNPFVQNMHGGYPMGSCAPPQPQPPPHSYQYAPSAQQGMFDMEMQRHMYREMGVKAKRVAVTAEDGTVVEPEPVEEEEEDDGESAEIDDDMKDKMKNMFIDGLMGRYQMFSSFDICTGTVPCMMFYPPDDPAVPFALEEEGETEYNEEKPPKWTADADCKHLRDSMKGCGTDEEVITRIVATRNNAQRQEIKKMFKTMYGRDLIEEIKSELSGDYRDAILACFVSPAFYDARCIKEAIYGLGTDEQTLIEILMTRTNGQIQELRQVYGQVARPDEVTYDTLIENDIEDDCSGDFKRLLISACQGNRKEITREKVEEATEEILNANGDGTGMFQLNHCKLCNEGKAKRDAQKLVDAGVDCWGTDEETFTRIFAIGDFCQLRATYREYVRLTQADIRNDIDEETSGNYMRGLKAIADVIYNRPRYFANKLIMAMKGLGTCEDTLIRIIASRSEIDMVQIKAEFLKITGKTLYRWIDEDCSFNFKGILQALVKEDVEMD